MLRSRRLVRPGFSLSDGCALAGLPWMTEFVYCDSLTPKERRSYGGRIFANILYEGNDGERVLVAQAHPGTFYVMNYDGSPIPW